MMTLFIADLTDRQRAMLWIVRSRKRPRCRELATSAAGWIAATTSRPAELVEVQHRYPEMLFAILWTNRSRAGRTNSPGWLYLLDLPGEATRQLFPGLQPGRCCNAAMIGGSMLAGTCRHRTEGRQREACGHHAQRRRLRVSGHLVARRRLVMGVDYPQLYAVRNHRRGARRQPLPDQTLPH